MFVLESILTNGIAQLSYLVGDTESGRAIVIDPRTDVTVYESLARKHGLAITHIFETHIHADFVSGSRSLADRVQTAKVYLSSLDAEYQFDAESVSDGQLFEFGSFHLVARHTPGHTPEHLAFELCEKKNPETPWAIFTGDSLFVGSAGRPDLLGADETNDLAEQLYQTLYQYYLKMEDFVTIYPGHGAGSACGADIGDRLNSTIGYERRTNKFLNFPDYDSFRSFVVDDAPPVPWHYPKLKKVNATGPELLDRLPTIPALPPDEFRRVQRESGVVLIDTRSMLAFGGGHVPGAINIGDRPDMSAWVGQLFDLNHRILLIVEDETDIENIGWLIVRTGHANFAGYLCGGMKSWEMAGYPLTHLQQLTVDELRTRQRDDPTMTILDVRSPEEWADGHVPGATHYFIGEMRDRITGLDKTSAYATYCASGYRASIASSLMKSRGFENVLNVPGSWSAWNARGFEVERSQEA
ncbi:MBL fold metallo-hydrolase [Allorhodopirellula heiligendammensis]|uniref:Polyketide biosynthesis zinc-dependent hydrolase BaeB n=1 Tax=Allorhodopirellula heiligendammensis TaxID=2714739 RepID=A0A5C6BUV1_9BACT|nr:MBL fold metallo-hydrolase [Allorhodopirellula heiligendammensis]TWU15828.1 putative polyketide biosynthesis zinc-dependent hydrolase BaeB [Allorhodopirellula heiligendammensis]